MKEPRILTPAEEKALEQVSPKELRPKTSQLPPNHRKRLVEETELAAKTSKKPPRKP